MACGRPTSSLNKSCRWQRRATRNVWRPGRRSQSGLTNCAERPTRHWSSDFQELLFTLSRRSATLRRERRDLPRQQLKSAALLGPSIGVLKVSQYPSQVLSFL
jgi:hypothetical protein